MLNKADRRQTSVLSLLRVPLLNLLGTGVTPFATGGQPAQLFGMTRAGIESGRALSVILMKFLVYQVVVVMFLLLPIFQQNILFMRKSIQHLHNLFHLQLQFMLLLFLVSH